VRQPNDVVACNRNEINLVVAGIYTADTNAAEKRTTWWINCRGVQRQDCGRVGLERKYDEPLEVSRPWPSTSTDSEDI